LDYLFRRLDGFQYFAEKDKLLKEEISKLSDIELQSSDESLKIILKAQNNVQLILFVNDYRSDNGEIQVNIRDDPRFGAYLSRDEDRKPVFKKARQILIHLPFSGSKELFDVRPLTRSFGGYPRAEIKNNEVLFTVEFFSDVDKAEDVEKKISKQIEFIKTYAGWLNDNINSFNSSIDSIIDSELIARRRKLSQDETILGKLGISNKAIPPIGFVKPEKKLDLKILDNKVEKIDPSLEMQTYDEIIRIINGLGINLERSCERLRSLGEPLRDSILGALNTFYKGMASAEAFNKEGKTDILLKYQDHNIFIAECKIWSTEDVFISGITQLLSYLTWRDTKTSYIIFSKNMDVRNVINKSKKLSERNSNFVSKVKDISDSCITYRFKIDLKTKSECYLTLHVFDLGLEP
jgi:hypothetical protein